MHQVWREMGNCDREDVEVWMGWVRIGRGRIKQNER